MCTGDLLNWTRWPKLWSRSSKVDYPGTGQAFEEWFATDQGRGGPPGRHHTQRDVTAT
jgi:hypothetical protein